MKDIHIIVAIILGYLRSALASIMVHAIITAIIYAWNTVIHLHAADKAESQQPFDT